MIRENTLTRSELLAALPDSLAEMAGYLPAQSVIDLATRYGGTRLNIPYVARESSELSQVIGLAAAQKLVARHAGELLMVPRAAGVMRAIRNKAICAGRAEGQSISALARAHQLTMRQVMKILKDDCFREKPADER